MPYSKVVELLDNEGSKNTYCLFAGGIDAFENISIEYDEKDRVKRWFMSHLNAHGPYHSTNVLVLYPGSIKLPGGKPISVIEKKYLDKYQR